MIYKDLVKYIDSDFNLNKEFDLYKYFKDDDIHKNFGLGLIDADFLLTSYKLDDYDDSNKLINIIKKHDINNVLVCLLEINDFFNNNRHILIYSIDNFSNKFSELKDKLDSNYIYKLSKYLITKSDNVEAIKLGIVLLSKLVLNEEDIKMIINLSLCDEFTFYCVYYCIHYFDNRNDLCLFLLTKVFGIGKEFLLDEVDEIDDTLKEWLLTDGILNCTMPKYFGIALFERLDFKELLEKPLSDEMFKGIALIFNHLIANVQKKDDNIDDNIMLFLNQFNKHKNISMAYITLANIYLYAKNDKLKNIVKDIVREKGFIKKKLKETNEITDILNILYLINIFKIDITRDVYHKFITDPYKYTLLMEVLIQSKYKDKCLLLLDKDFKDEKDSDYDYNLYNMLELLYDYPYNGINFIIRGLNHDNESFISRSIEDLYEWNRKSDDLLEDTPIYDVLLKVKEKDISKKIIDSINNLIDN